MIVVNLNQSYREVLSGVRDMEDATLGWWAGITDEAATRYGDSVAGVYKNRVVSVYDTSGFERDEEGRIFFHGEPSDKHASLIGGPSPVKPWVRGQARPIQYIETVALGDAPVENNQTYLRADVGGYVLTVDTNGIATLVPPLGGVVTVVAPDESRIFKFPS